MGLFDRLRGSSGTGGRTSPALADALGALAATHGLVGDAHRLAGGIEGHEVGVEREVLELAPGQRVERLVLRARLATKLDLGLRVGTSAESDPRPPIQTGDADFDARFRAVADEPERGQYFVVGELRQLLLLGPETELSDGGVTVAVGEQDAPRLEEALRYTLDVAGAMERMRRLTPAAADLREFEAAWRACSETERPIVVETTPLSASIRLGRIDAQARAVRNGFGQYHFELHAAFPEALGIGLALRPHTTTNEHGRDADPVGDRAFDRLFAVNARARVAVAALFDTDARTRFVALRNAGLQIRADDRGLTAWYGFRKDDLAAPVRQLWPLAEVAEAVARRVEAAPRRD